jgi:CubicO group peptidase (beta-lactamase class C family)
MPPTQTPALHAIVEATMQEGSIPGLALAVAREGQLLVAKGYGYANLEHMVPVTAQTVFKIASITKTFTATAVMMQVEQGRVDLERQIGDYLPGLPASWSPITLRHLLSHTSGIKSYEALLPDSWQPDDPYEQIVRSVAELPLAFPPGEAWGYSNSNYVVLGVLIEQVSGMPYRDFVRQQILLPIGMMETHWNNAAEIVSNRAQGYAWDSETLRDPGHPPLRNRDKQSAVWDYADGGLLSTVVDLAKWDAVLYTEELLQRSTLDQMWAPARLSDGRAVEYGLGWIVKTAEGHRNIGHWGRNPGFIAGMCRFLDDGLTVIVLCNRWKADVWPLVSQIGSLYLPGVAADSLPRLF